MPWCEDCAKFWNPATMTPDGACPTCGRMLAKGAPSNGESKATSDTASDPAPAARSSPAGDGRSLSIGDVRRLAADDGEHEARAPWHFKLMVVALVVYLGYRAYQLIAHFL